MWPTTSRAAERAPAERTTLAGRMGITRERLTVALGIVWILDALLQAQQQMWGPAFVDQMILPNAAGQPAPIAWSIKFVGHFLRHGAAAWNGLFALTQLVIGIGLLARRTRKPALVLMFAWSFGVWWFGEGFGQLFAGTSSPFMGTPGAVIIYALIGLLLWPTGEREPVAGLASAPLSRGRFGTIGAAGIWAGLWTLSAATLMLPANRAPGSASSMIASMADGQPGWYSAFLKHVASALHGGVGNELPYVLCALSLVIGLGPLVSRRPGRFLVAGMVLSFGYWITGQAVGSFMTGMGTDPQSGPLYILLGVGLLPAVALARDESRVWTTPSGWLRRHRTVTAAVSLVTVGAMVGGSFFTGFAGAADASASGASGTTTSASSSMPGMDMAANPMSTLGGDWTGTSPTTGTWSYSGPPLSRTEIGILTGVNAATDQGHQMQTPDCTAAPTAAQELAAFQLVQDTSAAVARYKDLSAAIADGYRPITDTRYPVVHYVKYGNFVGQPLDPNHVQSLVYATTPYGPVLVAAMYLMLPGQKGPMPGGCLTQWHAHTNLCASDRTGTIDGFAPCAPGTHPFPTPVMLHVWQVPVPGGPLALDPSDLQVVESAIMAQQNGTAPTTNNEPVPPGPGKSKVPPSTVTN